jgi:hypothetical protein
MSAESKKRERELYLESAILYIYKAGERSSANDGPKRGD